MGYSKEEKYQRILRGVKTLFFLITMFMSLLLFSAPALFVIADAFVPSVLLSALSPSSLSLQSFLSIFNNYDFRGLPMKIARTTRKENLLLKGSKVPGPDEANVGGSDADDV